MYLIVKDNGYEGHSATELSTLKEVRKYLHIAKTNWCSDMRDFEIYKFTKKLSVEEVMKPKD